ncbi:MAG: hypothetical protein CVV24_10100 [Ignavibacteriae bacterium HGW-Ignavibacteriae-3]|nr:MAG: hypothetical protein CVV24_10100 [Ignavibacteriae bacterium HGW-Ignavibacteriae-3]
MSFCRLKTKKSPNMIYIRAFCAARVYAALRRAGPSACPPEVEGSRLRRDKLLPLTGFVLKFKSRELISAF